MSRTATRHPIIVLTAPSGAGKTTIAHRLMQAVPDLQFSISATTRPSRTNEAEGKDYYFLTEAEFRSRVASGDFIEHEEVYPGRLYGTLRQEIERKTQAHPMLLDIDVKGALNVKRIYGKQALTIFVRPPSYEVLQQRLTARQTETDDTLAQRLERARTELTMADLFDVMVVNDDLETAVGEVVRVVRAYIERYQPADAR